jgi:hypothetical protein
MNADVCNAIQTKEIVMNSKFPVLSAISRLLWGLGWLIAVGGIVYGIRGGVFDVDGMIGVIVLALGLFVVAISEIIGVLFAIEQNTRTQRSEALPLAATAPAMAE